MRDSTKYDLAASEKNSVYSNNIGFGKSQFEDSIDLVCFEVTNASFKFDLCPKNNMRNNPKLSELFKEHSIPEIKGNFDLEFFGYNIEEMSKIKILYQTKIMLSACSIFEEQENKHILLKFLNIKCSAIELESSLNILLEITNKTSALVDQAKERSRQIMALLEAKTDEDSKKTEHSRQINISRADCFTNQIDYSFEFGADEIYIAILKENRKNKIQWKFLPLFSVEIFDAKIVGNIETEVTQRNQSSRVIKQKKQEVILPAVVESKVLSKKAELSTSATLYYFSFKLNFYEPFIERFGLVASYKSDEQSKSIYIEIDESLPLNVNLSTALFENIIVCTTYLNECMIKHGMKPEMKMNSQTKNSLLNLESNRNSYDYNYSIENLTGEEILVATRETDEYVSVNASQVMMLDFSNKYEEAKPGLAPKLSNNRTTSHIKSPYRKENFRIQSSLDERAIKVYLFIPSLHSEESSKIEENENSERIIIDLYELQHRQCIKFEVGDKQQFYFLCHEQKSSNDQRKLILRSPIQIRNTLQVPVEIKFEKADDSYSQNAMIRRDSVNEYKDSTAFKLYLGPDSTSVVPIRMLDTDKTKYNDFCFRLRPITLDSKSDQQEMEQANSEITESFDWSNEAKFGIGSCTERQLFEARPITLQCKSLDEEEGDENIYLSTSLTTKVMNSRDVIRFISINAPYKILNSLPFDMRIFLNPGLYPQDKLLFQNPNLTDLLSKSKPKEEVKTIQRTSEYKVPNFEKSTKGHQKFNSKSQHKKDYTIITAIEENKEEDEDESDYENSNFGPSFEHPSSHLFPFVDIKSSHEVSLVDTEPSPDLSISIQPPMYRASNFLNITSELEESDEINEEILQTDDHIQDLLKNSCEFRFLKKNTFIFQVTKINDNDKRNPLINICCDVTCIQGFYKLHFYTKYWFINSSELPLSIRFSEREYDYAELRLPYSSKDHEFHPNQCSQQTPKIQDIKHESDNNINLRLNSWNKYRSIKPIYDGLASATDNENDLQKTTDLQHEYGLTLLDVDSSDSEQEDKPTLINQVMHKQRKSIINEKHVPPSFSEEEYNKIRTFSKFVNQNEEDDSYIHFKIAQSKWSKHKFDIPELQKAPLNIKGKGIDDNITSEYSICSNFKYLPYPYSKTTLVTFVPKYKVYNKCKSPIFIYQNGCNQSMCLYPTESNIFNWTNSIKKKQIRIRYDQYTTTGPFKIDRVEDVHLKFRKVTASGIEGGDASINLKIIKVSIKEIESTFHVEFTEEDFTPPYRIENMTRHNLLVTQPASKAEEYDVINSYQIINYALSHPMNEKSIKIDLKTNIGQIHISDIYLGSFKNHERIMIVDKKNKVNFIITITRNEATKIIRVQEEYEFQIEAQEEEDQLQRRGFLYDIRIPKFGISLVDSTAPEEIAYIYFKNIDATFEITKNYQKFKFSVLAIQIDDQVGNENECIVLKKNGGRGKNFIELSWWLVNNKGYEHVIHYKELHLKVHPIELYLNGNF